MKTETKRHGLKRKFRSVSDCIALPNEGGGECFVEEKKGLSIKEMYVRMLSMNEIQDGMRLNTNSLNKEGAVRLMESATKPVSYLNAGEIKRHEKVVMEAEEKLKEVKKRIKESEKEAKFKKKVDEEIKKRKASEDNMDVSGGVE